MTEIVLIRHGQTDMNREGRFQGQIDVPLNSIGLAQARRLAERLARERFDAFYCSDLLRTRQTAEPSSSRLDLAAEPMPGLREQHFGILEGLSFPEVTTRHPDELQQWRRHDPDYALPGGESVRQFHRRVLDAIHALALRHSGRSLLVVTHGGVLDMVWRTARGLGLGGPRQSDIPNAGLSRVRLQGDAIDIVHWADTQHLADLPAQPVYDQTRLLAVEGVTGVMGDTGAQSAKGVTRPCRPCRP